MCGHCPAFKKLVDKFREARASIYDTNVCVWIKHKPKYSKLSRAEGEVLNNRASVLIVWIWLSEGVLGHEPGSYPDPLL